MLFLSLLASFLLIISRIHAFDVMRYAEVQYSILYQEFLDSSKTAYPSVSRPEATAWETSNATAGWTVGFFAGVYWNLAENNMSQIGIKRALDVTAPIVPGHNYIHRVDSGFVVMASFGNGYRLLKLPDYLDTIVGMANLLAEEYNGVRYCGNSTSTTSLFSIYIDNMMNLELLFEAANQTKNETLYDIAFQYANVTLNHHFRENNSTYHIVVYNRTDCTAVRKHTAQGYADWSTWSRGQSWAIYGFTVTYRYTKYQPFLDIAIGATNYVLGRLSNDTDLVPYWDYDAPYNSTIPYQPRDTSAGAIFASALIELSEYVPTSELKNQYLTTAKTIIEQLSSSKYMIYGNPEYKLPALLANGTVGPYPRSLYDGSLSYSDYFFTQAIVRLRKLK